jgi:hypothetical protein
VGILSPRRLIKKKTCHYHARQAAKTTTAYKATVGRSSLWNRRGHGYMCITTTPVCNVHLLHPHGTMHPPRKSTSSFVLCTMQGVSSLMPSHIAIPQASNKIHKYLPRWTAFYWLSQWSMDDRSQSNGRQPNRRSLQVKTRHTYHYIVIRKNSTMLYVLLTYNIFWGLLWHPLFIWHGIFRRVCMAWNNRFGVQVYN